MITTHPEYPALKKQAGEAQKPIHIILGEILETLREDAGLHTLTELTKDIHFYPDLHGKPEPRSPFDSNFFRLYGWRTRFERSQEKCVTAGLTSRPHTNLTLTRV